MSWDEIVGLTLTAVLIGGAVGVALTALVVHSGASFAERRVGLILAKPPKGGSADVTQTYARWLAARLTFSRASASFVAAFRALAAERRDSPQFPFRMEEALRARISWSEASRDLDLAEAMLLTTVRDPAIDQRLGELEHVSAEALHTVVAGDAKGVEVLLQSLHAADQCAIGFVRGAAAQAHGRQSKWCQRLAQLSMPIREIVDRWSRG
jgi:hypothetical protein